MITDYYVIRLRPEDPYVHLYNAYPHTILQIQRYFLACTGVYTDRTENPTRFYVLEDMRELLCPLCRKILVMKQLGE